MTDNRPQLIREKEREMGWKGWKCGEDMGGSERDY